MIHVIPYAHSTGAQLYEHSVQSDAVALEEFINKHEALLKAEYVGFVPQGKNYETLYRHIHLLFRSKANAKTEKP